MASSSSSSRTWKYDVFPSFSGEDVRKSFLSHCLEKLQGKSVITFIDNRIERSRLIELEFLLAIRQSRISIVVFSKKYASSTWCLNELAEIHECHEESDQMVIPIFYEVDPSHVRKQTGEFGKAFDVTCKGKTEDHIERWKKALAKVAGLAGYDSQNWSDEAVAIELISKDVLNKLMFTRSDDFCDFVGIDAHIEAIMDSVLCLESGGVRMVGIVGPSGIGKTTIARALFSRLSSQFDHRAFASYKRTMQDKKIADFGMKLSWSKHFLSEILCQKDIKIESLGVVEQRLKHRKVLIVLDDVDEIELLETLVGRTEWFGFGSRVIVVTQDRALLESHEIDLIYEVDFPSENLALQMFCRSAFRQNSPPDGFVRLAVEVASLAGNLPLGLNGLGSSLRGKEEEHWVEMMPRLRDGLNGKIEKTLRVCYDGLDEKDDQDIFLHIACLFNGESANYITNLLEKGFYTNVNTRLRTLADKSLVRITAPHETVQMHILLQKLGRQIVRAESINNLGNRRFLVDAKDISEVFEDNTGTKNVLGIHLHTSEINEPLFIDEKAFEGMRNLQFIKFYSEVRLNLPRGFLFFPPKLRLLHWDEYPAKYIPCSFSAEYMVELRMEDSKLEKLWEGTHPLRSLKTMNIAGSRDLKEIPDLSNATNLEILDLSVCTSLVTLPSSIRNLKKLRELRMFKCSKLKIFPTDVNLESLDYLCLRECSRLRSFPKISRNISKLELDGTAMEEEDCFWIENLSGLIFLDWENCPLRCMPSNFHTEHLRVLKMRGSKLEKLWEGIQPLRILIVMDLNNSKNLEEIPDLSKATSLLELDLSGCESLKETPDLSKAINLEKLGFSGCENLKEIPDLSMATNIWILKLNNCTSLVMLPSSIQHLHKLTRLDMGGCTRLEVLPTNINLVSLTSLYLSRCSRLTSFPQLSMSIKELNLTCTVIEEVPSWIENIAGLTHLWMRGCQKLRKISATIWNLKHLKHVDFTHCGGITSVSDAKTVAELHTESMVVYTEELHVRSRADTEFHFFNCFSLNRDAQKFILQSDFKYAVLPGRKVPRYFKHRTCGSSLTVPLPQSSLSQNNLGFTACIIIDFPIRCSNIIIVHWKFRGITGTCNIDYPGTDFCVMEHLVVFHFDVCPREEAGDPPTHLDSNNVEFEFKIRCTELCRYRYLQFQTCPSIRQMIKGCGIRVMNVSPSVDVNDRSSETEYTDQSGESDLETERCKKQMRMTIVTSQEHSNLPGGQTLAPNSNLSSGLSGASNNFHGDGTSLYHSLSPSYPCLEGESLCVDPMITEQQDTKTPIEDPSFSSQLLNFFRFWK